MASCQVRDGCRYRAYVRVGVEGADTELVPEVIACRAHVRIVIGEYVQMGRVIVEGINNHG